MERFWLRVLVIVLLGSTLGLAWGLTRERSAQKRLISELPPINPHLNRIAVPPTGSTGSTGVTGNTGSTGSSGATAAPAEQQQGFFISLQKAKELYDQMNGGANIVFVDAREFVEFDESHIAGAISVPKRRFDGALPKDIRENLLGNAVVVYCHGELCTDSEAVVKRMIALNLQIGPYYIIKDGLPGWEKAGYPMERKPKPGAPR